MRHSHLLLYAAGALLVLVLEALALASWQGWLPRRPPEQASQAHPMRAPRPQPQITPAIQVRERPIEGYFRELRAQLRWVPARLGSEVLTLDNPSRMLLAKSAARQAKLDEVGLGFADVYGIINAESSWLPGDGSSRDGTPNLGVAQFEPETAAALGVRDPHDVVEAVHAAAEHMREAAQWSASRIAGLKLSKPERARRLREGVSVYYNLSSRGRALWDGRDASGLPAATHAHIRNARLGAQEAAWLEIRGGATQLADRSRAEPVLTAAAGAAP